MTLLDGATGTELSRRGLETRLPLWSARPLADHPDAVREIHRDYLRAGADLLTTCTFRTHERNLRPGGLGGRGDELNRRAVQLARSAIAAEGRPARVAGSMSPLEDCYRPDRVPAKDDLAAEHGRQARSLAAAGVDLLLVETMATRREAEAAVGAASTTGLPVWCAFVTDRADRLLGGDRLGDAVRAVEDLGAEAILVNCVPAVRIAATVEALSAVTTRPFGAFANIGHADDVDGWRVELMLSPEEFRDLLLACRDLGAELLGGCCGTEPRHIAALSAAMRG